MKITQAILYNLTEQAKASPRLRMNMDLRNSPEDKSQRMLNAIEPGSPMPIHRHLKSSETVVCLRGRLVEEFYDEPYTDAEIDAIMQKALSGTTPTVAEQRQFKHAFLKEMAIMDYNAGWTQQFHYGAIRNNNTKMFQQLGADTGFDSIGEFTTAKACSHFLDELNVQGKLTKTILYNGRSKSARNIWL